MPFPFFGDPLGGLPSLEDEIRRDLADVKGVVVRDDAAIQKNHGDAGLLRLVQDGLPAGLDDGSQEDSVHALSDEGTDGLDLVFLLLLSVAELEVDPQLFGCGEHGVGLRRAPATLRPDLGEAHDQGLIVAKGTASKEQSTKTRQCKFLHCKTPPEIKKTIELTLPAPYASGADGQRL